MKITTISTSALLAIALVAGCGVSDGESEPLDTAAPSESTTPGESDVRNDLAEPDEADEPTETDAPAQDVEADQAAADAALLTLSDFPAGWSEAPADDEDEDTTELDERFAECFGIEADSEGIIDTEAEASTGDFTDPNEDTTISHGVNVAATEEELTAAFGTFASDDLPACLTDAYNDALLGSLGDEVPDDVEIGDVTVARLNITPTGDQTSALRINVPISSSGFGIDAYFDVVFTRVGRSGSALFFESFFSPAPIELIDEYNALAASRLPS